MTMPLSANVLPRTSVRPGALVSGAGSQVDAVRLAVYAALLAALVAAPLLIPGSFILTLANSAAITAIAALGLTVLTGTAGLLSLGQAGFLAVGAFTSAMLVKYLGAGFLTCLLAGAAVAAVIGAIVAAATVRAVGLYLAVGTLALQYTLELLLTDVEVKLTSAVGFEMPAPKIFGFEVVGPAAWWVLLCSAVLLCWLLLRWVMRSHVGRSWIVARDNPVVAQALGVSILRSRTSAFALSAAVAGLAGALHGFYIGTVQITNYTLHLSIVYLTVIVLGGPGRLFGAIWAAALITLLPQVMSWVLRTLGVDVIARGAGAENMLLGLILIFVLLKVPQWVSALLQGRRTL